MGGGGQLVGHVAQVVLDLAESLALGEIDQPLGHAAKGALGVGLEAAEEFLDARLAVIGGRGCGGGGCVHAGAHPGEVPKAIRISHQPTSLPGRPNFLTHFPRAHPFSRLPPGFPCLPPGPRVGCYLSCYPLVLP